MSKFDSESTVFRLLIVGGLILLLLVGFLICTGIRWVVESRTG